MGPGVIERERHKFRSNDGGGNLREPKHKYLPGVRAYRRKNGFPSESYRGVES